MDITRAAGALALLVLAALAGDGIARAASSPVPGPVLGAGLLWATLWLLQRVAKRPLPDALHRVADLLLAHMGLLFIPAAVSVITHADALRRDGIALTLALALSLPLGLLAAALTFRAVAQRAGSAP